MSYDPYHLFGENFAAGEAVFEVLVDADLKIDGQQQQFGFSKMALGLREEAWDHAFALVRLSDFAATMPENSNIQQGLADRADRARIVGLAHLFFWQCHPFEQEVREFVATKIMERAACRAKQTT